VNVDGTFEPKLNVTKQADNRIPSPWERVNYTVVIESGGVVQATISLPNGSGEV